MKISPIVKKQFEQTLNNMYQFDPYFDSLLSGAYFASKGLPVVNEFPTLKRDIHRYRQAMSRAKAKKYNDNQFAIALGNETYTQEIGLLPSRRSFYTLHWDIEKLETLITKHHVKKRSFSISSIVHRVSPGAVTAINDSLPMKDEPIMMLEYPLIGESPPLFVADGNYRLMRKYKRGDTSIEAYVIPPAIHMQAMLDERSRTAYKIHNNCYHSIMYMLGAKSLNEIKKAILPV